MATTTATTITVRRTATTVTARTATARTATARTQRGTLVGVTAAAGAFVGLVVGLAVWVTRGSPL